MNFLMFKLFLEKAGEPEIKLPTSAGSWKKQETSRKTSTSASVTTLKSLRKKFNNLRYADDTTLMTKSEEELKSLLMKVKEESEKFGKTKHSEN